jgi:hypothetical protein
LCAAVVRRALNVFSATVVLHVLAVGDSSKLKIQTRATTVAKESYDDWAPVGVEEAQIVR